MPGRNGQPVERLDGLTVRLLFVQFRLDGIKSHLDLLVIDASTEHLEEQAAEEEVQDNGQAPDEEVEEQDGGDQFHQAVPQ